MVDASPKEIEDARWHLETNELQNVHVLQGLVGAVGKEGQATFFLHTSRVVSTAAPPLAAADLLATWTRVKVPCVGVGENWRNHFEDEPCDLLKVDIEWSEIDFSAWKRNSCVRAQSCLALTGGQPPTTRQHQPI